MDTQIEVKTDGGAWVNLTQYMAAGGEALRSAMVADERAQREAVLTTGNARGNFHTWTVGPRKTRKELARIPGPLRVKRELRYRNRKASLAERLEATQGTGNLMVNICRSGTRQAAQRKAERLRGGNGQAPARHPNERLLTFDIKIALDDSGNPRLTGGTARQHACYWRAVDRFVGRT